MISGKTQNRSKEFLAREVPSPECLLGIASSGPGWPSSLSIAPLPTTPRQARDRSSVLVSSRRDPAGGTSVRQFSVARPNQDGRQRPQRRAIRPPVLCIRYGWNPTSPRLHPYASVGRRAPTRCPCPPQVALDTLHRNALGTSVYPAPPLDPHVCSPDPSITRTCSSPVAGEASVSAHG